MNLRRRFVAAVLSLSILAAVAAPAAATWCGKCAESRGYSVGTCALCLVEILFDQLGGW